MTKTKAGVIAGFIVSAIGLAFVRQHEGVVYKAYADPGYGWAVPTICTGHTKGVKRGDTATDEQCRQWLAEDLAEAGSYVQACTTVHITQAQYDALVSFQFNTGKYCVSTLRKKVNAGDCRGAAAEFDKWVLSNGKKLPGLVRRRAEERAMFETGCK